jgi:hypothetical protein
MVLDEMTRDERAERAGSPGDEDGALGIERSSERAVGRVGLR